MIYWTCSFFNCFTIILKTIKYEVSLNAKLLLKKENNLKLLHRLGSLDNESFMDFSIQINVTRWVCVKFISNANISNEGITWIYI